MAHEQEVSNILEGTVPDACEDGTKFVTQAKVEVARLLEVSGSSMLALCNAIEQATSKATLKNAFRDLNSFTRILLGADPSGAHNDLVRDTIVALQVSGRLEAMLTTVTPVNVALLEYKKAVVRDLAISMRRLEAKAQLQDEMDAELLSLLPDPILMEAGEEAQAVDPSHAAAEVGGDPPVRKRSLSDVSDQQSKPKRPRVPVLTSVERIAAEDGIGGASKRRALMTRERLRAGQHDPKGLLDLVDTSTSALDHAKKLELRKSAGFIFNSTSKKLSLAEQFNAATVRLDLGLGGQSIKDSLLFGAKVLSTPGVLTNKNVNDIENNLVDGNTTWTHQKTYVKMLTAGCLNQAKRIIEKFDEVLYGPAPEDLVNHTHTAIRNLLSSTEGRAFLSGTEVSGNQVDNDGDIFIRKIIEAVSPIIPITLRNRSLDGGYLRTALALLEATEIILTRFDEDVRRQANPAGAVGMAQAMHNEMERAILYGDQRLKPLRDFAREMRAQYQTSLGLGKSFHRDRATGVSKRTRGFRNRSSFRGNRYFRGQGFSRFQQGTTRSNGFGPAGGGEDYAWSSSLPSSSVQAQSASTRGRAPCFNYQAGNCLRGRACRFSHNDG